MGEEMDHRPKCKREGYKCWQGGKELEPSYTPGGHGKRCRHSGKVTQLLNKFSLKVSYDPETAALATHPREMQTHVRAQTGTRETLQHFPQPPPAGSRPNAHQLAYARTKHNVFIHVTATGQ